VYSGAGEEARGGRGREADRKRATGEGEGLEAERRGLGGARGGRGGAPTLGDVISGGRARTLVAAGRQDGAGFSGEGSAAAGLKPLLARRSMWRLPGQRKRGAAGASTCIRGLGPGARPGLSWD
jgi:hypothetical protein